jgi:ketosteroid isomerase-like protein
MLATCASRPFESQEEQERERAERSIKLIATKANAGDIETVLRDYYAQNAIIAYGGKPAVKTRAEAEQLWKDLLAHGQIEFDTQRVERSQGLIAQMGWWRLRINPSQGDFRSEQGEYLVVWKQIDGQWRVVMHTFAPEGFQEED